MCTCFRLLSFFCVCMRRRANRTVYVPFGFNSATLYPIRKPLQIFFRHRINNITFLIILVRVNDYIFLKCRISVLINLCSDWVRTRNNDRKHKQRVSTQSLLLHFCNFILIMLLIDHPPNITSHYYWSKICFIYLRCFTWKLWCILKLFIP